MERKKSRVVVFAALLVVGGSVAVVSGRRLHAEEATTVPAPVDVAPRVESHARAEPHATAAPAPVADAPVVIVPRPVISPITADMAERMRAIAARNESLDPHVFAKMGGSSVVSQSFLHCFESDEPNLAGRDALAPTLTWFREGRILSHTPFGRTSTAAEVGWSLRQGMSGKRPHVLEEVALTHSRFALAFFGSNDVEGKNAEVFAQRLDRLLVTLTSRGVIPVLGATYPRRARDSEMNEQVRLFNRMSAALASAWGLPYVDFHQAMLPLPGRGLAADGVHPNTYVVGAHAEACDFGPEGLAHGNNQRNLLVLEALDAVRRTVVEHAEPAPAVVRTGTGTVEDPERIRTLPFASRVPVSELRGGAHTTTAACTGAVVSGTRHVYRVVNDAPLRVRLSAVGIGDVVARIEVRSGDACLGTGDDEQVLDLPAGTHEISVVVRPAAPNATDSDARLLFVASLETP